MPKKTKYNQLDRGSPPIAKKGTPSAVKKKRTSSSAAKSAPVAIAKPDMYDRVKKRSLLNAARTRSRSISQSDDPAKKDLVQKRGRGRPRKNTTTAPRQPRRYRGGRQKCPRYPVSAARSYSRPKRFRRPPRGYTPDQEPDQPSTSPTPVRRSRGRPPKKKHTTLLPEKKTPPPTPKKPRGRPRKLVTATLPCLEKRRPGRPKKAVVEQEPFQLSLLPRWSINFFKREVVMKEPTDTQSQLEKLPVQEQDLPNDESLSLPPPEDVDEFERETEPDGGRVTLGTSAPTIGQIMQILDELIHVLEDQQAASLSPEVEAFGADEFLNVEENTGPLSSHENEPPVEEVAPQQAENSGTERMPEVSMESQSSLALEPVDKAISSSLQKEPPAEEPLLAVEVEDKVDCTNQTEDKLVERKSLSIEDKSVEKACSSNSIQILIKTKEAFPSRRRSSSTSYQDEKFPVVEEEVEERDDVPPQKAEPSQETKIVIAEEETSGTTCLVKMTASPVRQLWVKTEVNFKEESLAERKTTGQMGAEETTPNFINSIWENRLSRRILKRWRTTIEARKVERKLQQLREKVVKDREDFLRREEQSDRNREERLRKAAEMREAEKTKKRPRLPRCDPIPLKTMRPVSPLPIFTFEEEQFTTSPIQQKDYRQLSHCRQRPLLRSTIMNLSADRSEKMRSPPPVVGRSRKPPSPVVKLAMKSPPPVAATAPTSPPPVMKKIVQHPACPIHKKKVLPPSAPEPPRSPILPLFPREPFVPFCIPEPSAPPVVNRPSSPEPQIDPSRLLSNPELTVTPPRLQYRP